MKKKKEIIREIMKINYQKYHEEMVKELQKIIQIKTVLDTPVENGPFGLGNKQCLEYVLHLCQRLGFKTKNLDGYCGYAEVGEGKEIFGIIVHLDVVPEGEGWDYPPYEGRIVNDRMYGRGTWDDKGPAMVSIYAIKALMDAGFKFNKRVRIIFGCNEETGSLCVEHYIKTEGQITYGYTPDADFPVIYGEKAINNLTIQGKESNQGDLQLVSIHAGEAFNAVISKANFVLKDLNNVNATIEQLKKILQELDIEYIIDSHDTTILLTVIGKAAHGSLPMLGKNAASYGIFALNKLGINNSFIQWYAKYIALEYNGKSLNCYAQDEYGDIAVNVGIVKYEKDQSFVGMNCRLPFNTDSNKVLNAMKETLKDENVSVKLEYDSKGFLMDKNGPMIQAMMKAYQQVTKDYETQPMCIAGGTYARHFHNCVGFGASLPFSPEENIHSANERIQLKNLDILLEIYVEAIQKLLNEVHFE